MSVQTQIDRISGAVSAALTALSEKGVTVPAGTKVDGLADLIAAIEAGGGGSGSDTPTNVTLNFSWNAANSNYAPEVFYSYVNGNGSYAGGVYVAPYATSGSTTLTVAKKSTICIVCGRTSASLAGVGSCSTSDEIVGLYNYSNTSRRYSRALFLINNKGSLTVTMSYKSGPGSND